MRKVFAILSAVSLLLLALVSFFKNALETYFHVMLLSNARSFSSADYLIDAQTCRNILIAVAVICAVIAIVGAFKSRKD